MITVRGGRELVGKLEELQGLLEDFSGVAQPAADALRSESQGKAPKLSGQLESSIAVELRPTGFLLYSDLVYAGVQNTGGYHNIEGQHFLDTSGLDEGPVLTSLEQELEGEIRALGL